MEKTTGLGVEMSSSYPGLMLSRAVLRGVGQSRIRDNWEQGLQTGPLAQICVLYIRTCTLFALASVSSPFGPSRSLFSVQCSMQLSLFHSPSQHLGVLCWYTEFNHIHLPPMYCFLLSLNLLIQPLINLKIMYIHKTDTI